jgi:translocation and assembly module TamB
VSILRSSLRNDEPRNLDHPGRRRLIIAAKLIGGLIIFPILFGLVIATILINSSRGHAYLINLMQTKASQSLGVAVRLQNFDLHLSKLSVDLYGLTVDSAGPHRNPPLLQVQHAEAAVRVVSVFGGEWYFDSIRLDNPVAQIFVDKNGVSNLPSFKSNSSSNTSVFDLGIRHAVLTNGVVLYNNQPRSIALDLHDVEFNSKFDNALKKYSGTLAYSNGQLNYGGSQAPTNSISVQFDATPTTFHLSPAKFQVGNSQVLLTATVNNYSAPIVQAQYNAIVDGQQFAGFLHSSSIPVGLVSVSGSAQYHSDPNRTLLQCLIVNAI